MVTFSQTTTVAPSSPNDNIISFAQRTESTREREVFGYLRPWVDIYHPAAFARPSFSAEPDDVKPVGCDDTALAAFAQLGCMRMNTRRCMISLVSSSVEYLLTESTRTLSLQFDSVEHEDDRLWLGTSSFPREEGLTAIAIRKWRKARAPRDRPKSPKHYYTEGDSPHWFIVSDITTHEEYAEVPFVKAGCHGSLRFYCSIPIRSHHGSVIGTIAVMDDKPRYGVSLAEMNFMEDMSQTIVKHLEASKRKIQQNRGERLIQGLGLFNGGKGTLRDWWLAQDKTHAHRGRGVRQSSAVEDISRSERADHEFGSNNNPEDFERVKSRRGSADALVRSSNYEERRTSDGNEAADQARAAMHVSSHDFSAAKSASPIEEVAINAAKPGKMTITSAGNLEKPKKGFRKSSQNDSFDLATEIDSAYARASNLIREALSAEGALFFDANLASARQRDHTGAALSHDSSTSYRTSDTSDTDQGMIDGESTGNEEGCPLLGFSTRVKSSLRGFLPSQKHLSLSKSFLERLVRKYPNGKIFNFDEKGTAYSSSGEEGSSTSGSETKNLAVEMSRKIRHARTQGAKEAAALGSIFKDVQSVAFLPLWDSNSRRYRAGALIWSDTPLRFFDPLEDLTYLAAFGNSIVATINGLETKAAERAKTTFISSVSHELRSPLHGILGGLELLQTTELDAFQQEMTRTVRLAGITLLDTVSNILDYVKIDNLTKYQRKELARDDVTKKSSHALGNKEEESEQTTDLAKLTEDVIETIVIGRRFHKLATSPNPVDESKFQSFFQINDDTPSAITKPLQEDTSIMLDISCRPNWCTTLLPGTWTRILTNLVGNALKYTREGHVSIKLFAEDQTTGEDPARKLPVTLIIEDTGIGMSSDYMEHHLYTPFVQENSHSDGTGLGLSIVHQILQTMKGEMSVVSSPSKGTKITVTLPAEFVSETPEPEENLPGSEIMFARSILKGKRILFLPPNQDRSEVSMERQTRHAQSVISACNDWFGMSCDYASSINTEATADIYMTSQSITHQLRPDLTLAEGDVVLEAFATGRLPLVVLAPFVDATSEEWSRRPMGNGVVYLDQPIGPQKLARTLTALFFAKPSKLRLELPNKGRVERPASVASYASRGSSPDDGAQSPSGMPDSTPSPIALHPSTVNRPLTRHPQGTWSQPLLSLGEPVRPRQNSGVLSQADTSPASSGAATPSNKHVLLVEDNPINMKLLTVLMRKIKLPYYTAENGLIAVQKYTSASSSISLILMDMSMPIKDGFQATEEIRALEKKTKLVRCHIAALTGVTSTEARRNAFACGIDRFLAKPVSMRQIKDLIEELGMKTW